jgi:hypothetical protein
MSDREHGGVTADGMATVVDGGDEHTSVRAMVGTCEGCGQQLACLSITTARAQECGSRSPCLERQPTKPGTKADTLPG